MKPLLSLAHIASVSMQDYQVLSDCKGDKIPSFKNAPRKRRANKNKFTR